MKRSCVVVEKRTSWQRFVEEGRDPRVLSLVDERHGSVERMKQAHDAHLKSLEAVRTLLSVAGYELVRVASPASPFDATGHALVVTVGGDGTLLAASHHVSTTPILGVNSAPAHSVGHFCGATEHTLADVLAQLDAGVLPDASLARMAVKKGDQLVSARVLNDALFCHSSPAATSRYRVDVGGVSELQRSSGLWIGPPAGSTAAQRSAGGDVLPLEADLLQLVVREPYDPEGRPLRVSKLVLSPDEVVRVESRMHDASLFVDGPSDRTPIAFGEELSFSLSDERLRVLGVSKERGRS